MGIPARTFDGFSTRIPGAYTRQKFPPTPGAAGVATNVVAVIGSAKGGVPYNASGIEDPYLVNWIDSAAQGLDLLRGGDGYYMTEFYLTPTSDPNLAPPTRCMFVRVDPAVQGTETIKDGSTNDMITLTTSRYGTLANQIARKIEAGTALGHRITVRFQGETIAEADNVGLEYMEIQYVGGGTACTLNITGTQLDTTVVGGAPEDDMLLLFSDFPKLGQLVAHIDDLPGFTCILKGAGDADTTTFDAVTGVNIAPSAHVAVAHCEAVIQWFNSNSKGELTAEYVGTFPRADVANDASFIFFSDGSDGSPTSVDWSGALDLLKKFDVNHILLATGDAAYHAMLADHLAEMSKEAEGKNRSGGCGAASGTATLAARTAETKALNSPRLEYWVTPFRRRDILSPTRAVTTFDPFFGAALGAGIRFGNFISISATFKSVNVLAVAERYTRSEREAYIEAGGSYLDENDAGIVIGHNVSTYQAGENLITNLPSMLRNADYITLDSTARLRRRIANLDRAPTNLVISEMTNWVVSALLPNYVDAGLMTDDPATGRKAFSDVQFEFQGDSFRVTFTGIVPAPLHYVFQEQRFIVSGGA